MGYKRAYRLLALDLDGTIAVDGQMPTRRVRKAIDAAVAQGVRVVLATGRPFTSARRFAAALDLTTPLICYQGALIKESDGEQRSLLRVPMPKAAAAGLVAFAEGHQLNLTLYGDDVVYVASMAHPRSFYERWFGLPVRQAADLQHAFELVCADAGAPLKGLFIGEPADSDRLVEALQARFARDLNVVRSHELFVEVISPQVSKGRALAWLAHRYGIPQAQTIAVGDSGNDLSMVQWAGVGVAVRNATADVLAAADWIAPSASEDGVAAVIERFLLGGDERS